MSSLSEYVTRRLEAGRTGAEICAELTAVGWSKEAADAAYREGLIALGIPLPDELSAQSLALSSAPSAATAHKAATLDVTVNLFSFILLGIVAGAFLELSFALINNALPEYADLQNEYLQMSTASTIHRSIASMAIAFPLYVLAVGWWIRRFAGGHERNESRLSKWFTYLVLLVASVTIVCDLITLVYSMLQGEMSLRFLLKVAVVLAVAGTVFGFYLCERRSVQFAKPVPAGVFRVFGWGAAAAVLVAVLAGYLSAGSPQTARELAADSQRANDLTRLSDCLGRYAGTMGQLPASLEQLARHNQYTSCPTADRETRQPFAYRVTVESRPEANARVGEFELCAQFALSSGEPEAAQPNEGNWRIHPAGRSCRVRTVQLLTAPAK